MKKKYLIIVLVLILAIISLFFIFNNNDRQFYKYIEFNSKLKSGAIKKVVINQDSIFFTLKSTSRRVLY